MYLMKYFIVLFFLCINLLNADIKTISIQNYTIFLPEEVEENIHIENLHLLKTKDDNISFFILKIPHRSLNNFVDETLEKISHLKLLTNDGYNLVLKKKHQIKPVLKSTGCLEKKFYQCFEILNYSYNSINVLIDIVLEKSHTPIEIIYEIVRKIYKDFTIKEIQNPQMNQFLFYRVQLKFIENQNKDLFILGIIIPKNQYNHHKYLLERILATTNILPPNITYIEYEEYIDLKPPSPLNLLFVLDNSISMSQEIDLVKKNILNYFDKISLFSNNFSIGLLTTDSCKLKIPFTNNKAIFEQNLNNIMLKKNDQASCVYISEKFLSDSNCNNQTFSNLSIICITDKSDAYYLIKKEKFNEEENIFVQNRIPFYSILPLNKNLLPDDCSSKSVITNYFWNYSNKESTNLYAVDLKLLAQKTDGDFFSICNEEYDDFLENILYNTLAKYSFIKLSRIPIASTIQIEHESNLLPYFDGKNFSENQTYYIYSEEENSIILIGKEIKGKLILKYYTFEF